MAYVLKYHFILHLLLFAESKLNEDSNLPLVINTWAFLNSTEKAWNALMDGTVIDAVEAGCAECEYLQCDGTVGFGGSPDENGETTLDAMIMNGTDLNVGAVAGLRRIKHAISVARHVLENTKHSLLVGDLATQFAEQMGFTVESLQTPHSYQIWKSWTKNSCQPNFWTNVAPDPTESCGPYHPTSRASANDVYNFNRDNHDTIGMIAVDGKGRIAAGTSTNGATHKVPGRVGDSPIPGAGAYADDDVGAAAATGDGDVMMRLLPSFLAVEEMRRGASPTQAAEVAIKRIIDKYQNFFGGVIAVNKKGEYGAACHGMDKFPYSVRNQKLGQVTLKKIPCQPPNKKK